MPRKVYAVAVVLLALAGFVGWWIADQIDGLDRAWKD